MATSKVWLISGANTGFGLELALKALKEGDRVIAAVRTPNKIPLQLKRPEVATLPFDLSWPQEKINAFAEEAFAAFGTIDVVVNNAAYGYFGAIEESTDEALKTQYDINVFGPLRLIRAVLPQLRAQGSGTIVNISSVGGFRSYASNGMYCSTKFALEGITEALAMEIAPFGLRALIVEPGYFRTNFLGSAAAAGNNVAKPIKAYEGTVAHEAVASLEKYNGKQPGNPVEGAARIWEVVRGEGMAKGLKMLLRLPLGSDSGVALQALAQEHADTAKHYEAIWKSTDFND